MNQHFLLTTATAKQLYDAVRDLPIIDYHNHLSINDILENKKFTDIYDLWIKPDPYKHRAMRMCGVKEEDITGVSDNLQKFTVWWQTLPKLIGNPLYHWSLMELRTVFGFDIPLNGKEAQAVYEKCNEYLGNNEVRSKTFLERFGVELACPCASILEDVSPFEKEETFAPSLRGDDMTAPTVPFIKKLEEISGNQIRDLLDFEKAISKRLECFRKAGCRYSDHALDNGFKYHPDDGKNGERFKKLMSGNLGGEDREKLTSYILTFLGKEYSKSGFVMQLHIGAQRYTSTRLRNAAGAQGGFAAIGNCADIASVISLLDCVDLGENGLPKTLLFCLNPNDNAAFSVLSGSYSKDGTEGLVTQGPAWWWCDHKKGMEDMLENMQVFGLLHNFVGMTTDSRSFLSFVRHDYFRRVLCSLLGEKFEKGEYGCDKNELIHLCRRMCYGNAKETITR